MIGISISQLKKCLEILKYMIILIDFAKKPKISIHALVFQSIIID
jgi:hypothetical protein